MTIESAVCPRMGLKETKHTNTCAQKNNGTLTVRSRDVCAFTMSDCFCSAQWLFYYQKTLLLQRNISNIWLKCLSVILFIKNNNMLSFIPSLSVATANLYTHHNQSERETTGLQCPHSTSYDSKSQLHAS